MTDAWKDYAPYALLTLVVIMWQRERLWAWLTALVDAIVAVGPWLAYVIGGLAVALAAWGTLQTWYHDYQLHRHRRPLRTKDAGEKERHLQDRRTWVLLLVLTGGAALGIWGTYFTSRLLSGLDMPATYFAMVVISLTIFFLIDRFAFDSFDTTQEIQGDPKAVALVYVGLALLFVGAGLALGA